MSCTASPGYISRNQDKVPKWKDTPESLEGTWAHEQVEAAVGAMLEFDISAEDAIESLDIEDFVLKKHILEAAKFFHGKVTEDCDLTIEAKLNIWYKDDQSGYVDYLYLSPEKITVWDFKFGQGMEVTARNNLQLAIYAISVYESFGEMYGWTEETLCVLGIYQPRINQDQPTSLWAVSIGDLKRFVADTERIAHEIQLDPAGGVFRPSKNNCRFCPAKEFCVPKAKNLTEALPLDFEVLDFENPESETQMEIAEYAVDSLPSFETLSPEQITAVLNVRTRLAKWMEDLKKYVQGQIEDGKEISGWKVVAGNGQRKWKDLVSAEKLLRNQLKKDECFNSTLLSPPQAEKALAGKKLSTRFKNRMVEEIIKSPGKPTLAAASDKRESIVGPKALGFEDLEQEGDAQPENEATNP